MEKLLWNDFMAKVLTQHHNRDKSWFLVISYFGLKNYKDEKQCLNLKIVLFPGLKGKQPRERARILVERIPEETTLAL